MTKFSDNDSPSLLFTEQGSTPTSPAASHERLFVRSSDHVLCTVDSSGTVRPYTPSGLADPMTTRGDMIKRNSSNVTARQAVGTGLLHADGTDVSGWSAVVPADLDVSVDNTTADATTGHHGLLPKLGGGTTNFLRADGTWNAPAGGGGGLTVQWPPLKPGTPTYDFAGASLDGAFSAYSTSGTFVTGDVLTQGAQNWPGSSCEMMMSGQMGGLSVAHSNTDLDFTVGGFGVHGNPGSSIMIGIAALNSSGTGVGITAYSDTNCYLASITTYGYAANSDNWGGYGLVSSDSNGDYWMRLKRVSGTWTGYVSRSGRAWDKTFSTRADSVTVSQLVFGILYLPSTAYNVRVWADYMQVDV